MCNDIIVKRLSELLAVNKNAFICQWFTAKTDLSKDIEFNTKVINRWWNVSKYNHSRAVYLTESYYTSQITICHILPV